ncbi:MAG: DNA polymerase III subunit beta, partial [Pseudomonadota bacterium]
MRVTIERQDLLRSLTHVQSVVERRNTIPILSNLLVKADNSGIQLSATDLDIEVVETSPA